MFFSDLVEPPEPIKNPEYLDSASFFDVLLALLIFGGTCFGGLVVFRKVKCLNWGGRMWGVDYLSGYTPER